MFNIKEFILKNLIDGVNGKVFAKEYASTLAVNYMLKGILTNEDIERFDVETTPVIEEEVIEEVTEEIVEEEVEIPTTL